MTWVKIDDQMPDHPKFLAMGPMGMLAFVLQLRALCYSARYLTDGFIPDAVVARLTEGFGHWSIEVGGVENLVAVCNSGDEYEWPAIMVESGLWDKAKGGYRIHDYHDYNPTRESVERERKSNTKRQKHFRDRNADSNAVTPPVSNAVTNGPVTGAPSPSPSPSLEELITDAPAAPSRKPTTTDFRTETLATCCGITEAVVTGSDGKPIHRSDALKWWGGWRRGGKYRDDEIAEVLRQSEWAAKPWNPARVFRHQTAMEFEMMLERQRKTRSGPGMKGLRSSLIQAGLLPTEAA